MTQQTTVLPGSSFTVPASNITKCRVTARGAAGSPGGNSTSAVGRGLLVQAILSVTGSLSLPVTRIAGGAAGPRYSSSYWNGGKGGDGINVANLVWGPGGGGMSGQNAGGPAGDGGIPNGADGAISGYPGTAGSGGGGAKGAAGGTAGSYASSTAGAGQSHAAGGQGGPGGTGSSGTNPGNGGGGGGGGYAGGAGGAGGGTGAAGGGGSGFGGVAAGFNDSTVADALFEVAAVPLAPTLLSPSPTLIINRAADQTFTWRHNGATDDPLDGQVAFDLQYKIAGGSWVTVPKQTTADQQYVFAASTFAAGDYEWQVRTYADGLVGPWSSSGFFTAANVPATPVISSPVDSQTITDVAVPISWSSVGQTTWQARVVASGVTLADSGSMPGAATSATLTVTANHVAAQVQVRIKDSGGLWSDWASVNVTIEWVGPVAPVVRLRPDPAEGRIGIEWTQPTTDPAVDHYDVRAVENGITFPVVSGLPPDARSAFHYLPLSDVDTTIRVLAVAASGASTAGEAR